MRKIIYTIIDDVQIPLLFTLGAQQRIAERMGSIDALFDMFDENESEEDRAIRAEIEAGMTDEQKAKCEKKQAKESDLFGVLAFCIATLAQQAQLYNGDKPTITEQWVEIHAAPCDTENLTVALCKAMGIGLTTIHDIAGGETDLVAEALEKN
ncbi:MAG: hypothetical protein RR482_00080 [Clostridia bacterium]